jgi:isopenicillin N synthase-like dioxygenase
LAILDLPIVDASIRGGDIDRLAASVGRAARATGFFYLTGHGIPRELVREMLDATRGFFAKDGRAKAALAAERSAHRRGYMALGIARLAPGRSACRREAFNIGLELPMDHPEIMGGFPLRGPNQWPADPAFRKTMLAYFWASWSVGRRLHRAVARDLGMPADFFADKLDRPAATLRLLHYPPQAASGAGDAKGIDEHTDDSSLTLLTTDGTEGLEVRRPDGSWIRAPHVPGAFIVNVGNCLMRWTNDVYVSAPHRVVHSKACDRYSVAFFLDPNPDAEVCCLPTCISAERPARYAPTTGAGYLAARQLEPTFMTAD